MKSLHDPAFSYHYQQEIQLSSSALCFEWEQETLSLFDNLIVSWNADRPQLGYYVVFLSVKRANQAWSSWFTYAHWGTQFQKSFSLSCPEQEIQIDHDILQLVSPADAFRVRIEPKEGANLKSLRFVSASASYDVAFKPSYEYPSLAVALQIPHLSQMCVNHPRYASLCSPTSLTAVLRYLKQDPSIDVTSVAREVWDGEADIFGNWVFNIAQASVLLGSNWRCWVSRLNSFTELLAYLYHQTPVIVSVKGSLPHAPFPYKQGHLIVVCGYDAEKQHVLCMDPAFSFPIQASYPVEDFIKAWANRGFIAYLFQNKINKLF